ncbi:hypothetical protein [Aquibacillus kalidii]|uniref:hypothetical protein n=1 Tax=Aquibacillus kalidii TaxID=2762597 RepID=UPI001648E7A3|nr:hypothetical protein [Aquibacillus kalidii]
MKSKAQPFLRELETALGECPNKQEIIDEYQIHVEQLITELEQKGIIADLKLQLVERLGSPKDIAAIWWKELGITPQKIQWLFVMMNFCMFIGGGMLTVVYNKMNWRWVEFMWDRLVNIPFLIIMIYLIFWVLLGYEVGKEFGPRGSKLLKKTFSYSIVPNIVLMNLTVFKLIPYEWFQPFLTIPFILVCILLTGFFYPVCCIGYHYGKKISV